LQGVQVSFKESVCLKFNLVHAFLICNMVLTNKKRACLDELEMACIGMFSHWFTLTSDSVTL